MNLGMDKWFYPTFARYMYVIIYPYWDQSESLLVKRVPDGVHQEKCRIEILMEYVDQ